LCTPYRDRKLSVSFVRFRARFGGIRRPQLTPPASSLYRYRMIMPVWLIPITGINVFLKSGILAV
jgi:hypothetical protein